MILHIYCTDTVIISYQIFLCSCVCITWTCCGCVSASDLSDQLVDGVAKLTPSTPPPHWQHLFITNSAHFFIFIYFPFTPPIPDSSYTSRRPASLQADKRNVRRVCFLFQTFVFWHVFCHFAERVKINSENSLELHSPVLCTFSSARGSTRERNLNIFRRVERICSFKTTILLLRKLFFFRTFFST